MHHASSDFDWNEQTIGRLRALWAEGHSTAEIGRRLGVSKNAIVGKVHRLQLDGRPSPIRAPGSGRPRPVRPVCPKLPPLPSLTMRAGPSASPAPPKSPAAPPARPIPEPMQLGTAHCCWPIGEPGKPGFRFCDDTNAAGRPYCPEHCRIAYRKVRDRRERAWDDDAASHDLASSHPALR